MKACASKDNSYLGVVSYSGTALPLLVTVYDDVECRRISSSLPLQDPAIKAIVFSDDNKQIAIASEDERVAVFNWQERNSRAYLFDNSDSDSEDDYETLGGMSCVIL